MKTRPKDYPIVEHLYYLENLRQKQNDPLRARGAIKWGAHKTKPVFKTALFHERDLKETQQSNGNSKLKVIFDPGSSKPVTYNIIE